MVSDAPTITPEKIRLVSTLLRDRLHHGPMEMRQAYARLLMDEVAVTQDEIQISSAREILARVASDGANMPQPAVLSFVREWRAVTNEETNSYAIEFLRENTRLKVF